jgi:hypothetical protein
MCAYIHEFTDSLWCFWLTLIWFAIELVFVLKSSMASLLIVCIMCQSSECNIREMSITHLQIFKHDIFWCMLSISLFYQASYLLYYWHRSVEQLVADLATTAVSMLLLGPLLREGSRAWPVGVFLCGALAAHVHHRRVWNRRGRRCPPSWPWATSSMRSPGSWF